MPIYEYTCKVCGHEFEVIQGRDEKEPPCPECGKEQTEKKAVASLGSVGSCGPKKGGSGFS